MLLWDLLGAFILTYFVSRGALALLSLIIRTNPILKVAGAHLFSWVIIALLLGLLRSNAYYPFMIDAGLIYFLPQALWLLFDMLRIPKASSSRSSRSRSSSQSTAATTTTGDPTA
ncbi:MAG: hypothetical protein H0W74_02345 [Sphingosinicella sp.]|nr:hypothetical protein [Sphingosinicella sp.]